MIEAFICPNDGHVIIGGLPGDDKVLCPCGKPNPNIPKGMQRVEKRSHVHYKSGLERTAVPMAHSEMKQ